MKIIACPKGGKIPEGYCRLSCLNFSGQRKPAKRISFQGLKNAFLDDERPWLQIYKEEIVGGNKIASRNRRS